MKKQINFSGIAFAVLIMIVIAPIRSWAQGDVSSYKVGEKVEYKEGYYPRETWFQGTVVKLDADKGVYIRWDPRPESYYDAYMKNGVMTYQQFYGVADVRHLKAHDKPEDKKDVPKDIKIPPDNRGGNRTPVAGGRGLMTKADITGYLLANAYANGKPINDPEMCKDLIEQIKLRGVKEQFGVLDDDIKPLGDSRCWYQSNDTNVYEAIDYNLGRPLTTNDLVANWNLYTLGATVDTVHADGNLYRQNEFVSGKYGFITIRANGTYTWKVKPSDPPASYLKGSWRNATKEEMGMRGGAGVVLQKAADDRDWIVYKYLDEKYMPGGIDVRELPSQSGGNRSRGWKA